MDSHDPNEQLLQAVRARNLSLVNQLLEHPNINVNYHIKGDRRTMLFEAATYPLSPEIFATLLNRGYSIKGTGIDGGTLLHFAVDHFPAEIVHKLIKRGADVNVYDNYNRRPLSIAALKGDLEIVCMLLYYRAEVHWKHNCALLQMVHQDCYESSNIPEVAKVLYRHTDLELSDLTCMREYSTTTLYRAVSSRSPIALEILSVVDAQHERCEELLDLALEYPTSELFRTMWNLFRGRVEPFFIIKFFDMSRFDRCGFSDEEWLEVLNGLLNSHLINDIYEMSFINQLNNHYFLHYILHCLSKRNIEAETRLDIITFFVSLGVRIREYELDDAYKFFSFKDELRFLIFAYNYNKKVKPKRLYHVLRTLFTLEINRNIVRNHLLTQVDIMSLDSVGYFAVPQNDKVAISVMAQFKEGLREHNPLSCYQSWRERLKQIPEMPSLVEASRNKVMRAVKNIHNVTKAYEYLELLEKSNLPPFIKDILLLKVKIY